MKKNLFYHIYLTDDNIWVPLFLEQFKSVLDFELANELDNIVICSVGSDEQNQSLEKILEVFCKMYQKNIVHNSVRKNYTDKELHKIDTSQDVITETFCLKYLWNYCNSLKENEHVLYFHAKGITSIERHFKKSPEIVVNYYFWRKFLEWGVIENYKLCCEALSTHNAAGVNFCEWPAPHYSGGFWWANSDFIKKLPDPERNDWWRKYRVGWPSFIGDRIKDEMWIGFENTKMFSLCDHAMTPPVASLAEVLVTRKEYCK